MNPIVEKVYQIGIIPVIAFNSVDEALPLCKALAEGGLPAAEVTFRTACAEECIRKIHEEMPDLFAVNRETERSFHIDSVPWRATTPAQTLEITSCRLPIKHWQ